MTYTSIQLLLYIVAVQGDAERTSDEPDSPDRQDGLDYTLFWRWEGSVPGSLTKEPPCKQGEKEETLLSLPRLCVPCMFYQLFHDHTQ